MSGERIRVLLVDDQALIRLGFRLVLEEEPDIEVVGEAADGEEAIAQARASAPDVVVMDIRMPRLDGIRATAQIVAEHPLTRVLALTTFDLDEYAFGALAAGASGFLLKDAEPRELVGAIRAIHRGDAVLAPRVTRALIERMEHGAGRDRVQRQEERRHATELVRGLTGREHDVFLAVAQGRNNAEIAALLHLGQSTVKTHVGRLLAKLGARDRVQLVVLAHRAGLGE